MLPASRSAKQILKIGLTTLGTACTPIYIVLLKKEYIHKEIVMDEANLPEQNLLNDVRFLRDVVTRTQRPAVNQFWPVTLSWGCIITFGYLVCGLLARAGRVAILPWVFPGLIFLVAFPLHWYLVRKVRHGIEQRGVRPRLRKDLMACWCSLTVIGLLWTAGLGISGMMASHWYLLFLIWGSLYFVGYVMNGVLLSDEWLWAAGILLASIIAVFLAGTAYYWLLGLWMGGTMVLAGLMGRRNAHRQVV
jgi:hypothetical protein